MNWKEEYKKLFLIIGLIILAYNLPVGKVRFDHAVREALTLIKWYAREHVILCLVPAFFIAGFISIFISQASIIKYFGAQARKWVAYAVASVSGSILAVCSCTILPLFSSIYRRGAGIGPAIAFLYSGPAINILAIILTARILGAELGMARVVGAVVFSVVIGIIMHFIYIKEEKEKAKTQLIIPEQTETHPLGQTAFFFFILISILVFSNWGKPDTVGGFWHTVWTSKWWITALFGIFLGVSFIKILNIQWKGVVLASLPVIITAILLSGNPLIPFCFGVLGTSALISSKEGEPQNWMASTWGFAKQILPLLAIGILMAGLLLGSPEGNGGLIPNQWVTTLVGSNSVFANFFASILGAFMYFATLTEVPILQGLINCGMDKGPALSLLLAGPALSLPNMLVVRSVIGTKKTIVFVFLVVFMAALTGLLFGLLF